MIPRIRGKVGQAEDGPHPGKWYFEMWMTTLGSGDERGDSLGLFGPWENQQQARDELQRACQMVVESIEQNMVGQKSGKYIDMLTNRTRRWDKSDEN